MDGLDDMHPFDHSLLACRGYPGGRLRHVRHDWRMHWWPVIRRNTACRTGRHRLRHASRGGEPIGRICMDCAWGRKVNQ